MDTFILCLTLMQSSLHALSHLILIGRSNLDLGLQYVPLTPSSVFSPSITAAFHSCCVPSTLIDTPGVAFPENCSVEPWFLNLLWNRKGKKKESWLNTFQKHLCSPFPLVY